MSALYEQARARWRKRLAQANAHRPKLWMCPDCHVRVRVENAPSHADACCALQQAADSNQGSGGEASGHNHGSAAPSSSSSQPIEYSRGYAAALDLVEQEARRRAERSADTDAGRGRWKALTDLADFCRSHRGTP